MTITWTIAIDWGRNGNYTDTYDDVTSRDTAVNNLPAAARLR